MIRQEAWSAFPFRRLIAAQIAVAALAASMGGLDGAQAARSALAGAVICGGANVYAAWRVFVSKRGRATEYGELANLYRAEVGKFVMIGALSAALFAVSNVAILAYIGGCIMALLTGTLIAATFNPDAASTRNKQLEDEHGE